MRFIFTVLMCLTICIASVGAQTSIKEKRAGKEPLPALTLSGLMGNADTLPPEAEIQGRFLLALGNDDVEEVSRLLRQGARVNQPFDKTGQTAIMLAQSLKMAQLLTSHGATIGMKDADDGTVLHYAVTRESALELIPFFIAKGADINARGWEDETPLHVAISYFNESTSSQAGQVFTGQADTPSVPSSSGNSMAQQVIELLAKHGANLDAPDAYGYTPLMQCTVADNPVLVKLLLKLGADKNIRDKAGRKAVDVAEELGRRYIYQLLE